jgi:hypothetical protein
VPSFFATVAPPSGVIALREEVRRAHHLSRDSAR